MHQSNKGSALISALFIMTLVAIAATAMSTRLQLDIYHTRLSINSEKYYRASNAITLWAIAALKNPQNKLKTQQDGVVLTFPASFQPYAPELHLRGQIIDLQSRFNINNLSDRNYYLIFLNLIDKAVPKLNKTQKVLITEAIKHWIANYQLGRGQDEYMKVYLKNNPPYYPSQQWMVSSSEFRLVNGVERTTYLQLSPYLTALPQITPININSATSMVLAALAGGLNENQVNEIIHARSEDSLTQNKLNLLIKKLNIRPETITFTSEFFLVSSEVRSNEKNLTVYSLLRRQKTKGKEFLIHLIGQSINTL